MALNILGIDPSLTKTGLCLLTSDGKITFKTVITNNKSCLFSRLKYIRDELELFIRDINIDLCLIEDVYMKRNTSTYNKLCHVQCCICSYLFERNIQFMQMNESSIRNRINKSYKTKLNNNNDTILFVKSLFSINTDINEHEADACLCVISAALHSSCNNFVDKKPKKRIKKRNKRVSKKKVFNIK